MQQRGAQQRPQLVARGQRQPALQQRQLQQPPQPRPLQGLLLVLQVRQLLQNPASLLQLFLPHLPSPPQRQSNNKRLARIRASHISQNKTPS